MHPPEVRAEALALVDAGLNDCEISRRLGIPRATIRDWRRPTYVPRNGRPRLPETCPRCWRAAKPMRFSAADYAEFLGFYLGDGCVSDLARTQRLRIALDLKYPGIIESARALLDRCFPENPTDVVRFHDGGCAHVSVYCSHLECLLPQHGPGRKHERPIELEEWQERILALEPWPFIRACIWTDGCSFINRTGPYEYLSYDFTNHSKDVVDLFTGACDSVGLTDYRVTSYRRAWKVRINRRPSVALMLEHVGIKR
jgi:hypothetical protein